MVSIQNNSACSANPASFFLPPNNFYVCVITPVAITWQPTSQILSAIPIGGSPPPLPLLPPSPQQTAESSQSSMPAIIGAVLGIIVLGLGTTTVFFLMRYKKAKNEKKIVRVLVPAKPLDIKPKSQLSDLIPTRTAFAAEPVQTENPIMRSPLFKAEVHGEPEFNDLSLTLSRPALKRRASVATFLPQQVAPLQRSTSVRLPPPSSVRRIGGAVPFHAPQPMQTHEPIVRRIGEKMPPPMTHPHAQSSRKVGVAPMQAPRVRVVKATNSVEAAAIAATPGRSSLLPGKSIQSLIQKFNSAKDVATISQTPVQIRRNISKKVIPHPTTVPMKEVDECVDEHVDERQEQSNGETKEETKEEAKEEAKEVQPVLLPDDMFTDMEEAPSRRPFAIQQSDETTARFAHGPQQVGQRA
jgi:hypothetical protein